MQRIDTSSALVNAFGVGKFGFQDGNPATATPATFFNAAWCNAIQEELCSIVEGAGLVLNPAVRNQIVTLLQSSALLVGAAGGTSDVITSTFAPAISAITNGQLMYVRAAYANATVTPTFSPGAGIAAHGIVKGANQSLVVGDIAGAGFWMILQFDAVSTSWVLQNPATGIGQSGLIGELKAFAGATLPTNYMACPTAQSNQLITSFPALYAAIGHAWEAVAAPMGSFSIPWIAAGGTLRNGGTIGASDVGSVIAHTHTGAVILFSGSGQAASSSTNFVNTGPTGSTGGTSNIASGANVRLAFKYQ